MLRLFAKGLIPEASKILPPEVPVEAHPILNAASAALDDQEYAKACWSRVREQRQRLTDALTAREFSVLPSQGNFVLATVPAAGDAGAWYRSLKSQGVLVRFFDKPGLRDKLRITVGTSEENDALLAALDAARSTVPA